MLVLYMSVNNDTLQDVVERSKRPMSDAEITKCLGSDAKVIEYGKLADYESIQQLLPKKRDYVVILVGVKDKADGHWQAVIRNGKKIIFFCSYGERPDKALLWSKTTVREDMNQDIPHLSLLLNKAVDAGFKVTFNDFPFQSPVENKYATCGRWLCLVISYYMHTKRPSLKEFHRIIMQMSEKYELVPDLLVSKLVTE
jgi:hypothetical protein